MWGSLYELFKYIKQIEASEQSEQEQISYVFDTMIPVANGLKGF